MPTCYNLLHLEFVMAVDRKVPTARAYESVTRPGRFWVEDSDRMVSFGPFPNKPLADEAASKLTASFAKAYSK